MKPKVQLFEITALVRYSTVIAATSEEDALKNVETWETCWPNYSDVAEVVDVDLFDVRPLPHPENWQDYAHDLTSDAQAAIDKATKIMTTTDPNELRVRLCKCLGWTNPWTFQGTPCGTDPAGQQGELPALTLDWLHEIECEQLTEGEHWEWYYEALDGFVETQDANESRSHHGEQHLLLDRRLRALRGQLRQFKQGLRRARRSHGYRPTEHQQA